MAESRVIQDSDESDAELSDAASSIDPLQDQEPPAQSHPGQRENEGEVEANQVAEITDSSEPVVNFDSFLVTQSSVTASQKEREEMWIGGDTLGVRSHSADPNGLKGPFDSSNSNSELPFAWTPDETRLRRGQTMEPPDSTYSVNPKRRRTGWGNELSQCLNFDATQESSLDIFATTGTSSSGGLSGQLPTEMYNANFSIHQHMAPAPTSEQSTTMKMLHVEIPGPPYDTPLMPKSFNRSKSMPAEPDSPNDTEPMSSITFARARRAISNFVDPQQSQEPSTFDASPQDLTFPESVEINVSGNRTLKDASTMPERDELDSEDFGGMPKEMYKPRPSRARSTKSEAIEPAEAEPEDDIIMEADAQYQASDEHENPDQEELGDIPLERYEPRPSRSRSKVQESIETTEPEPNLVEKLRTQTPDEVSNDQDELTCEDFGGMPKEIYNPRPSRSRGKTQESVELEGTEVRSETKSKKRRRSPDPEEDELNFEILSDIPQEQYKPRPSRSRSKPSDLVYIDQCTRRGYDPGLAVVIPREVPVERVKQDDARQDSIKSEPMDEESPRSQPLFENHEDQVNEPDPIDTIDTIRHQEPETSVPEPSALPPKKGRKRKGTVDSEATSRANSTVPEKPAPKKRGRKKKVAETPIPEPAVVSGLEDPFNETPTSAPAPTELDPNRDTQQNQEKATHHEPKPTPEEDIQPQPSPKPQPQLSSKTQQLSTPEKQPAPQTPPKFEKGPDKHSPISIRNKVPFRVGLSRRARIAPLLKVVRK